MYIHTHTLRLPARKFSYDRWLGKKGIVCGEFTEDNDNDDCWSSFMKQKKTTHVYNSEAGVVIISSPMKSRPGYSNTVFILYCPYTVDSCFSNIVYRFVGLSFFFFSIFLFIPTTSQLIVIETVTMLKSQISRYTFFNTILW